jgi:acyl-CoA dehydrogenase
MDFNLTGEQKEYLDMVRRFVGRDIIPVSMSLEKGHTFPFDIIRKAWDQGILNLSILETVKGYSLDLISTALIIRELAYGDSGIATSAMCNDLANAVIAMHGTEAQQQAFLSPFVERPLLASFCLTEPNAGSDNSGMTTLMQKGKNGKYLLNGSKCFITNASFASQFTVFCKVGRASSPFIACVVVPALAVEPETAETASLACREIPLPCGGRIVTGKPEDKLGQRLSNTATVSFEDVVIEDNQIIGDRRLGFQYLTDVLDYARPMVAAIGVGIARRAFDVTVALTALIVLLPLLVVLAILVRVNLGAPIFFRQDRPGLHGKTFTLLKFRTMTSARDENGNLLPDEKRLTRFGQLLRSTSLDELPELLNVLRGEMSLGGPRPLLIEYLDRYSPEQARRHDVLPGITGWAQVNGRNAISWEKRFALDVWYVDHRSLWLDLRILARTVQKVVEREGISEEGTRPCRCSWLVRPADSAQTALTPRTQSPSSTGNNSGCSLFRSA